MVSQLLFHDAFENYYNLFVTCVKKGLNYELFQHMFTEYYRNHNEISLRNTWWFCYLLYYVLFFNHLKHNQTVKPQAELLRVKLWLA